MTEHQTATLEEVRALPVIANLNVPLWDGDARDDELHAPCKAISVSVVIKPDLPILGHLLREHHWDSVETYIVLREWNEQVLLHEVLHVVIGSGPDDDPHNHRVINAAEVALAPFVCFGLPDRTLLKNETTKSVMRSVSIVDNQVVRHE